MDLSNAIPLLQQHVQGLAKALPAGSLNDDAQKLLASLVEDCETLARENALLRETFLRLLIALSEDSEENIRTVEAEIRGTLLREHEGT